MSNYSKTTNFAAKDTLNSGDPNKVVKGTEINTEFDNIATAVVYHFLHSCKTCYTTVTTVL